jgi:hypothetical protein
MSSLSVVRSYAVCSGLAAAFFMDYYLRSDSFYLLFRTSKQNWLQAEIPVRNVKHIEPDGLGFYFSVLFISRGQLASPRGWYICSGSTLHRRDSDSLKGLSTCGTGTCKQNNSLDSSFPIVQ